MSDDRYTHVHGFGDWVATIKWDDEGNFTSPPIGPFATYAEANKAATRLRKRLRQRELKWQRRVDLHQIVSLDRALGWSGD